jgi:hypothetical protein
MAATDDLDLSRAAWRKSSYSGNGGDCVEVAAVWRKSACGGTGGSRAGAARPAIAIRDSKDPGGPALAVGPAAWHAFTAALKAGGAGLA